MRIGFTVSLLLLLCGCGLNRANYDPFSFAPMETCWYYRPDCAASVLRFWQETATCSECPPRDHRLSLAEVIDLALINNPKTHVSWAEARVAAAEWGKSQSVFLPTITGQFFYENQRTASLANGVGQSASGQGQTEAFKALIITDQTTWGPQLLVDWTLLDFGQRRYTTEAARYALYAADFTHSETLQEIIENVSLQYFDYLAQIMLLEADEANLADTKELLDAAELGLKQGTKNISDVLQARTQFLLSEITLAQERTTVNTSYAALLDQMGLPSNETISFLKLPVINPEKIELQPLDSFIEMAMRTRPDILAARATLASHEMSLKSARRLWTPTLDYSLEIGRTYFNGGFHDDYDYTSTLTLSMPIFTGFRIANTIKSASSKVEVAKGQLREVELTAIQQLTSSHFNVGVAYDVLNYANSYLETTTEEYKVALAQYRAGINTILDVVTAQSSLFDARAKQAQAIKQLLSSMATLVYSAGILYQHHPGECQCD